MSARRTDCEQLIASTRDEDSLIAHVPGQHAAVGESALGDPGLKIGTAWLCRVGHGDTPSGLSLLSAAYEEFASSAAAAAQACDLHRQLGESG